MSTPALRHDRETDGAWIWIVCIALSLALGARASEAWSVRFGTGDEIWQAWIRITDQLWPASFDIARGTGRIYFLLYIPTSALVTSLRSDVVFNLLNVGSFVLGPLVLGLSFRRYVGLAPVLLALLLHAVLFAQLPQLPPMAYPVVKYYPLLVVGLAIFTLQAWLERGGVWRFLLLASLIALSLFQYESITVAAIVLLGFALLAERASGRTARGDERWRGAVALYLGLIAAYGAAYLGFRAAFPSVYAGNSFAPFVPAKIAQVVGTFGIGGTAPFTLLEPLGLMMQEPLLGATWFETIPLPYEAMRRDLQFTDVAIAVAAFFGVVACLARPVHLPGALFWLALATALALFVGANLLHALSVQYQAWVDARPTWIGSRYSLIALILAATALLVAIRSPLGPLPAFLFTLFVAVAVAAGALLTASNNRVVAAHLQLRTARFDALNLIHACPALVAHVDGRTVLAPRVFDVVSVGDDAPSGFWSAWIQRRYKTHLRLVGERDVVGDRDLVEQVDARLDWRVDQRGRVVATVLADGDAEAAPARVAVAPGALGFLSWRDERWAAHTHHVDRAAGDVPCQRGVTLVTLPGLVRADTVELNILPRLDRLAPTPQTRTDFNADAASDPRQDGWSVREPNGSWTNAPVAHAVVPLPPAADSALQLELTGFAYNVLHKPLGFTVRADGVELGHAEFSVPASRRQVFPIPDALARRGGNLVIEIAADELRSPSDDGLGDPRRLGVFVQTIVVRSVRADAARPR
ncbi:hypothetical protein [Roseiterribacter gracilis]|uniref:Uncharacterized protein n=1 Tax=Roseiterribacter gracilis TaxID=2812848 RepID=A0A8S8XD46_9PROT|nr:hypothetical protein TMPK1_36000 [Rhodospirillales bacterium TMPK1]